MVELIYRFSKIMILKKVLLMLLVVCGFMFLTPVQVAEAHDFVIEVRESGFTPDTVEIEKGDKVTFVNKGSLAVWPASDIHPTHGIYPEFDPKREIKPGESWSFIFDRVGVWRFHDHLFPDRIGKVTVTGDAVSPSPEPKEFTKGQFLQRLKIKITQVYYKLFPKKLDELLSKTDMYREAKDEDKINYWLTLVGPTKVMEELVDDTKGGSIFDCHQEAHKIGRTAYEIFGPEVFSKGDSSCHSGFYHGAMETFLNEKGTLNLAQNVKDVCNKFSTSFSEFECLHGVGHGLMAYLSYDLPESLKTCNDLEGAYAQSSCYGGVFMENIIAASGQRALNGHATNWVSADPLFPCDKVDSSQIVQTQCYLMQTSRMLQLFNYDFKKVSNECSKTSENVINTCFQSLGRDAAGQTLRDPKGILNICNEVPDIFFNNCLQGGLNVIIDFWGENIGGKPYELCKIIGNIDQKNFCYSSVFGRLSGLFGNNKQKIREECGLTDEPFRQTCLNYAI